MMESTQPVFIIGIYCRYGVQMADVIRLRPLTSSSDGRRIFRALLSCVKSIRSTELRDVGLHFKLEMKARPQNLRSLIFERESQEHPEHNKCVS